MGYFHLFLVLLLVEAELADYADEREILQRISAIEKIVTG